MADEILKRDENRITVLAGVTDDANTEIRMLRVDPTTKRLLISAVVTGSGANTALSNLASVAINTTLVSDTDNTDALGTAAISWSDLFLGNGSVITWSSAPSTADVTLTHSANTLTLAGGSLVDLGATTATTFNGLAITANGTNTLNITAGKTLAISNTLTFSGTDGSTLNIGTGGTLGTAAYTASTAYATSAQGTTADNAVPKATYDAHTILYATTDNTPVALTVGEQTVVGRATGGNISALAIDSDLSSVSANDDTIPSAKATKAMGDLKLALAGGNMSGAINEAKGTDIASASSIDIGAGTGNMIDITGTTTITALGTVQAGTRRILRFTGALTLTHNATSLILPTGANITTVAGDTATMVSLGSGNWVCTSYQRKDGSALAGGSSVVTLLKAGTGSGTSTTAENVDTIAISGLTNLDTLKVIITAWADGSQNVARPQLYNDTDSREIFMLSNPLNAGRVEHVEVILRQVPPTNTNFVAIGNGMTADNTLYPSLSGVTPATINAQCTQQLTAWTGSWTLALRHGGVASGGAYKWTWAVYKVAGQ